MSYLSQLWGRSTSAIVSEREKETAMPEISIKSAVSVVALAGAANDADIVPGNAEVAA